MLIDYSVLDRHWSSQLIPRLQRRDGAPLQLFVAGDVDGLCALRLLEHVLAFDHVAWEATPVLSYDDLTSSLLSSFAFTRLTHSASHPASYLLVQCGANVDLTQLLQLDQPHHDHVLLYVLDSHRPLHFNNLHHTTQHIQLIAPSDDLSSLPPIEDEPSDDDDEDDDSTPAAARRRARESVQARNRALFREYYAVSYYSTPVSVMTYDLCVRLNRESALALWWAITGLTDALVHQRVGEGQYDGWVNQLNESRERTNVHNTQQDAYEHPLFPSTNPQAPPQRSPSSASASASPALAPQAPSSSVPSIDMPKRTAIGHITFHPYELRLLHLRHLPLYDSMQHSPYLSSHLRRWNDRGVGHIRTLLVELGIPLEKARQQWMEEEMLWRLKEGMEALIDKHPRLKHMRMASFTRQCTPTLTLSAVDTVHIAAALLEQDRSSSTPSVSSHYTAAGPPSKRIRTDADSSSAPTSTSRSLTSSSSSSSTCPEFWDAYRAVGCGELPVLMRGLHLSIHLMTLVNTTGLELMKKRLIRSQGPIRYAILSDGPSLSTLAHPLLLLRLAMFLYDCTRQMQEKRAQGGSRAVVLKPMVVACLAPGRGVYVVVGVQSTMEGGVGEVERSRMASAFRSSAMGVGILDEVRHDSFDGTSMEVPHSKMHRFIEYMHTVLTHI